MAGKGRTYIFDSYAVLAYLEGEQSADKVKRLLGMAGRYECTVFMSIINLGEVLYITEREQGLKKAQIVLSLIEQLPITILPASREAVYAAAHIKAQYSVSYADAFAVAEAINHAAIVVTGDPEFVAVKKIIKIEWLKC